MITPDDPRHGSNPGYNAGCRQTCCKHAHMVWMKKYRLYGGTDTIPATGTHRRIQALMAIGHPLADISQHAGKHRTWTYHILNHDRVRPTTADLINNVYNQLHMQPGHGWIADRARRQATARGWVPPLAWDDIDNDPHPPTSSFTTDTDQAAVWRSIDGDRDIKLTPAERRQVIRALHTHGLTDAEISVRTGMKVNTVGIVRQRLGLDNNPARIDWADYGDPARPRNRKKVA